VVYGFIVSPGLVGLEFLLAWVGEASCEGDKEHEDESYCENVEV